MRAAQWLAMLLLALFSIPSLAQLSPPQGTLRPKQAVSDASMVINDRNTQLEVLPSVRAESQDVGTPQAHHVLRLVQARQPFSRTQLGVVFNHTLQTHGILTGEISFKLKGTVGPNGFDPVIYPGLTKLTNPNIYVVTARTPTEFVAVFKALKGRSDVEWVEPYVMYGSITK